MEKAEIKNGKKADTSRKEARPAKTDASTLGARSGHRSIAEERRRDSLISPDNSARERFIDLGGIGDTERCKSERFHPSHCVRSCRGLPNEGA